MTYASEEVKAALETTVQKEVEEQSKGKEWEPSRMESETANVMSMLE